jgi:hypothetical protein
MRRNGALLTSAGEPKITKLFMSTLKNKTLTNKISEVGVKKSSLFERHRSEFRGF